MLADNLDLEGEILGSLDSDLMLKSAGLDFDTILDNMAGQGKVTITDGRLQRFPLLQQVVVFTSAVGIRGIDPEGTDFSVLGGDFTIGTGAIRSDNFRMVSKDFDVSGKGSLTLSGALRWKVRLRLSEKMSRQVKETHKEAVFFEDRKGRVVVPLLVTGSFDNPAFGLDLNYLAKMQVDKEIEKVKDKFKKKIFDKLFK